MYIYYRVYNFILAIWEAYHASELKDCMHPVFVLSVNNLGWSLTYFSKILTLVLTFEPEIGLHNSHVHSL